ncbi:hypothetical protein GGR41_000554 [Paenalcaligenes hominis]|uniref:DUF4055 domain-containing protein n=1 Tax=Paenalcaligenes hominis TaxID=643674 RepID=A0ABX0WM68_9BURK|nr:DUF4055 domain-containing protein [Paenalcaligenes hominis]NJB64333.1 hypothetical protein [Paenalcaligenes hominis]GGE68462.1 DNA-binding protein [Paenalcaligenes hominis]
MSNKQPVDQRLPALTAMAVNWPVIDALRGGTAAMRQAGIKYLPKRRMEEPDDYKERLGRATLSPSFVDAVDSMVGRVFTKPIGINDSVPEQIRVLLEDVDTEDRNLHAFARDWMDDAISYGISHVLVDMPPNTARTQAEEKALGVRPYGVLVKHDQILGWRSETQGGGVVLTQVRIREVIEEEDGPYGVKEVEQIRVLEIGRYELHRKNKDGAWFVHKQGKTTLDRIPLITLYANRTGFMLATPPLLELAWLNVKHWQKQSSLDTLIETACVPILATIGVQPTFDENGNQKPGIVIGAKSGIDIPLGGDIKYVEHSGAAIESGRNDLKDLEEQMRIAGGHLLKPDSSVMTAAQAKVENAKEVSRLGMIAQNLEDCIDQLLGLMGEWMKLAVKPGNVQVHVNLDPDSAPAESMGVLIGMYNVGALSRQGLFEEAKRRGLISDDATWEQEQAKIESDGPESGEIARLLAEFKQTQGGD